MQNAETATPQMRLHSAFFILHSYNVFLSTRQVAMRLSPRQVVATAGALFWLASMLVQTGTGGIIALWTHALFIGAMLAIRARRGCCRRGPFSRWSSSAGRCA